MQNIQIELNCLAYLMQKKDPDMLVAVNTEYFGNHELAKIFLLIRRFYVDQGEFMGWDVLRGFVARACKTADTTKFLMSILDQAQNRDISGLTQEILLKELKDYHKFRLVLNKVEPLVSAVEVKDIDSALGKLKELYDSVFIDAEYRMEDADMSSMATRVIKFNFRKTGIKPIDERGGLIVGGYTIVAAPAKMGKSTIAGMIALHQYLHEEGSIAIFSYEMGASEVRARILANFADIDLGNLMSDCLDATDQRQLLKAESEFYCGPGVTDFVEENLHLPREKFFSKLFETFPKRENKFFIFDERLDYDDLMIKMNLLATTKNVKLFIIDYPWLIPRGKAYRDMQGWEYQLQVSKNWKTFSHKYGLNVITPAQLDQGKKNDDPKLRFVTNAINDTDLTLFLTRNEEDKILETVTFTFAAMRNFISVPGTTFPPPFKMANELNKSRFRYTEF